MTYNTQNLLNIVTFLFIYFICTYEHFPLHLINRH